MEFCKQFNARTQSQSGMVIPVVVTIFSDRTFTFITKTPPAPNLLLKEAGIDKGSASPNRNKVGKVSRASLKKIAEIKMADLNASDLESAMKMIAGTAPCALILRTADRPMPVRRVAESFTCLAMVSVN